MGNTGVIIFSLRNVSRISTFLALWSSTCSTFSGFYMDSQEDDDLNATIHDDSIKAGMAILLKEFKGPSQASLAYLLANYDFDQMSELLDWGRCKICKQAVEIPFHDDSWGDFTLQVQGLP